MAKKKKKKAPNRKRRAYQSTYREFQAGDTAQFLEIKLKYLPNLDSVQIYFDGILSGYRAKTLGNIDHDASYSKGILIKQKKLQPWMTVSELWLLASDFPNLFAILRAYDDTIGDLLDSGSDVDRLPTVRLYNDGQTFLDADCLDYYKLFDYKETLENE